MSESTVLVLPSVLVLVLVLVPIHSAPVQTSFRDASIRAQVLVQKILQNLVQVHASVVTAPGLTFDPADHAPDLQLMMSQLDLPPAPVLKPLSSTFTLESCVQRMWEGCELHQRILGVLSTKINGLSDLNADLRDLQNQISTMKALLGLMDSGLDQSQSSELAARLHGDYEAQVAAHLTLTQLRSFCHDVKRSLRAMSR